MPYTPEGPEEEMYPDVPYLDGDPRNHHQWVWSPGGPGTVASFHDSGYQQDRYMTDRASTLGPTGTYMPGYGGSSAGGYGPPALLDHAKLNAPPPLPSHFQRPSNYDPLGEPKMVPFVVPQAIDEYAVRDSPWAPWPISIPSYGRFINPLGGQNIAAPYGLNPRPIVQPRQVTKLDEPERYKPRKRYFCDGESIQDEFGDTMGWVKRAQKTIDILAPDRKTSWLRYSEKDRAVFSLDPAYGGKQVVARYSKGRPEVVSGNPSEWYSPTTPKVLYEYSLRKNFGDKKDQLLVYIYDGVTNAQIGLLQRPQKSAYPSQLVVGKDVPNHMLLIALFLI